MIDYYGDTTRWFIGIVKSLEDPLKMGRVQVRIYGIHGQNLEEIPDEVLPWAQVLTPVTEGGVTNLGNFLGIQIDARVFGIFMDGKNSQMPLVMGSIPHSEKGETASGKKTEVTTNANAQGTTADKESVEEPVSEFDVQDEPKKEQEMIEEPQQDTIYKPVYPHNKVTQTTSGHVIEVDDTPDAERIHIYHKSGTHVEMQPNGDVVAQHANGFRSVTGNDKLYASGDVNWIIEGNVNFSVLKDITFGAKGNINLTCEGTIDASAKTNVNVATEGSYINTNASTYISGSEGADIRGSRIDLNKGGTGTPSVRKFEWAGNEEPTDETPGGADEVPTDADGNPLGPESAGGPAKGEGKSGDDVAGSDNLSKAGSCGRSDLGSISAKYESNGKPGAIGRDSTGGYSYGSYQIATKTGTMGTFMNYLKNENQYSDIYSSLNNAGGASAATSGSGQFQGAWKNLASNNSNFKQAQHDFIQRTHHDPAVSKIKKSTGIDICDKSWSNGVQDAVWSTSVQHGAGGANTIFQRALARTGKTANTVTDAELINAIYAERGANNGMKYFPSSTSGVRQSVVNRFVSENQLALQSSTKDSIQTSISNFNKNITSWTGL